MKECIRKKMNMKSRRCIVVDVVVVVELVDCSIYGGGCGDGGALGYYGAMVKFYIVVVVVVLLL